MTPQMKNPGGQAGARTFASTNSVNYTSNEDNLSQLLSRLDRVKQTGNGKYIACCPVHSDKSPSLGVTQKTDGIILMHCFGCGAGGVDICEALNINTSTLFPPSNNPRYEKTARSGFSAWQLLRVIHADLTRLLIISSDLKKIDALSADDSQFISEVVLRLNASLSYLEGTR